MSRSREGNGRHRQPWHLTYCPFCGQEVEARRTVPGKPVTIRVHWHEATDRFCPPLEVGRAVKDTVIVAARERKQAEEPQLRLFG